MWLFRLGNIRRFLTRFQLASHSYVESSCDKSIGKSHIQRQQSRPLHTCTFACALNVLDRIVFHQRAGKPKSAIELAVFIGFPRFATYYIFFPNPFKFDFNSVYCIKCSVRVIRKCQRRMFNIFAIYQFFLFKISRNWWESCAENVNMRGCTAPST